MLSAMALVTAGCGTTAAQRGVQGQWAFRTTYGYYSDLLMIQSSPQGSINPATLAVYPKRWVLLRTKGRTLARTFAAETRGTATSGTVRLRDARSGKRYAGRYERLGDWLRLHFVPGTTPPPSIIRRARIHGAAYARLRWDGAAPRSRPLRCPARRVRTIAFHKPRATFDTLLLALEKRDGSLFARCFVHPPPRDQSLTVLVAARQHLWRSCFLRQRLDRRTLHFWYLVTDPRNHARTWQDRGRMLQIGNQWKILKL